MRAAVDRLKAELRQARAVLSETQPPEPVDPTPAELASAVDFIFRQATAEYLLEADREPARIVGYLLAALIGERATYMEGADREAPILGTVDGQQVQKIMRVVADRRNVVLVDLPMEKQIGGLHSSPELVAILRDADLPVWEYLLKD